MYLDKFKLKNENCLIVYKWYFENKIGSKENI